MNYKKQGKEIDGNFRTKKVDHKEILTVLFVMIVSLLLRFFYLFLNTSARLWLTLLGPLLVCHEYPI